MSQLTDNIRAKYPQYSDIPDAELEKKILAKYPQYRDMASKTPTRFAGNVVRSGADAVVGTISSLANVFNPNMEKNTVANLAKLSKGGAQLLDPTKDNRIVDAIAGILPGGRALTNKLAPGNQEAAARSVGNFYDQRYGISDIAKGNFKSAGNKAFNSLYNDPVGVAMDASVLVGGTGAALKGAGAASKVSGLTRAGNTLTRASSFMDPISLASKGTGALTRGGLNRAGKALETSGTNFAIKGYGQPQKLAKFGEKFRPAQEVISEYGLYGKDTGKLADVIEGLQGQFDDIARNSGRQVSTEEILNAGLKKIEELRSSGFTEDVALAKQIEDKLSAFIDTNPRMSIDIGEATNQRLGYDQRVKQFALDPTAKSSNQMMRDIFQNEIRSSADGLVTASGENLAQTGNRLNELRSFEPIMTQAAATGKSTRPLSLGKMVSTGVGGAVAGLPGAVAAYGADAFLNSPKVIGATSKGMQMAGKALQQAKLPASVGKVASIGYNLGKAGNMANKTMGGQTSPQGGSPRPQQVGPKQETKQTVPYTPSIAPTVKKPKLTAEVKYKAPKNVFNNKASFGRTFRLKPGGFN